MLRVAVEVRLVHAHDVGAVRFLRKRVYALHCGHDVVPILRGDDVRVVDD